MKLLTILALALTLYSCKTGGIAIARDYQIELTDTGTHVYQHRKLIGFVPFDTASTFDKFMISKNQ